MPHPRPALAVPILVVLALFVSACGGGGGGAVAPGYADLRDILRAEFNAAHGLTMPDGAALAAVGRADYRGAAGFARSYEAAGLPADPLLMAEARLSADFAGGALTGELTGFHDAGDQPVPGTVRVTAQFPTLGQGYFTGDLLGLLTWDGQDRAVTGPLYGQILGQAADQAFAYVPEADFTGERLVGLIALGRSP